MSRLQATDRRISVHFGRLERRTPKNDAAAELLEYMAKLPRRIDAAIYRELVELGKRHRKTTVFVEKAVDVMLAVDMVVMAERNEFDTAYLLSADGDYTHAVDAVRVHGKKVLAVAASPGAQLARVVNTFIRVDATWFGDCYD